jgi:membrane-bound lytic murein transglycosylase B
MLGPDAFPLISASTRPARRRLLRTLLGLVGSAALPTFAWAAQRRRRGDNAGPAYAGHAAAMAFAADLAERHAIAPAWSARAIGTARRIEAVRRLIMPPPAGTAKNWAAYRARFVEPRRISAGVAFWRDHEAWLAEAEQRWGVPPEIVVAIVGVETFYGRVTGRFRVVDALATLAFDFPPGRRDRSAFFREQLEEFLVWCHRERLEPATPLGSYAGAIGLPQFMPGSINRFAVDMDGDGHINLLRQPADAIGSVARFLAEHGWQRGEPTQFEIAVPVDTADRAVLLGPDIKPSFTATQMQERGAELPAPARAHGGPLALVELQNGDAAPSYVAGTANFYAMTRYNWSAYYAMAVIELATALERGFAQRS